MVLVMILKKTDIFKYLLLTGLLFSIFCPSAQAWEDKDLQHWTSAKTATIEWGGSFENGIYKVEAFDFPRIDRKGQIDTRYVGLHLYENGVLVGDYFLQEWESVIYNGEMKISCDYLPVNSSIVWHTDTYEPEAKVTIWLRGRPDITITTKTNATYRVTDQKIPVTIDVKNKGTAPLEEVKLDIDLGGLEFYQFSPNKDLHYKYDKIEDGASIGQIAFDLKVPSHMRDTEYKIGVNVTGIDEKDESYDFSGEKNTTILNMVTILKTSREEIFMTDTAFVQVIIRNDGSYGVKNIELQDSVGNSFELIGNTPLKWNFDLGPGEFKDFKYNIKPVKPDLSGYLLPKARATWEVGPENYNQISGSPRTIVHGSKILLEKTVSPTKAALNANVTVTVTATNVGDVKASVEIFDDTPLPDNVTLVSGNLYTKGIVAEKDSISMKYIIKADMDDEYVIPKARAIFVDLQGYKSEELSSAPKFTAGNPQVNNPNYPGYGVVYTPIPTPTPQIQPGFEIVSGLMGFALAVFILTRSQR